jgi:hypothetical protein
MTSKVALLAARFREGAALYERQSINVLRPSTRQEFLATARTYRSLAERLERAPPRWMTTSDDETRPPTVLRATSDPLDDYGSL